MTSARFTMDGTRRPGRRGRRAGAEQRRARRARARASTGAVTAGDDAGWTATIPLEAARWGGPALPLPTGDYELRIDRAAPSDSVPLTMLGGAAGEPRRARRADRSADRPGLRLRRGPGRPRAPLRRAAGGTLENAVFFESFYGRNASCNPLAIDRELAAAHRRR